MNFVDFLTFEAMIPNWQRIFSNKERCYYLACSGGVDSMVLCYLMYKARLRFEILHVNYQLRGEDSNLDEQLVLTYGNQLGVKVHIQRYDTTKLHQERGGNLEELCRDLRYQWFQLLINESPDAKIVLAHHQDDQIETFYLNLARKSGMVGLASLRSIRNHYLRPLLSYTKQEIYVFARQHQIPWREDYTNQMNDFRRNKLRNEIVPFLEIQLPTLRNAILLLIDKFQENLNEMESEIKNQVDISNHFQLTIHEYQQWNTDKKNVFLQLLNIRTSTLFELNKMTSSETGKWHQSDGWMISKLTDSFAFDKMEKFDLPDLSILSIDELPTTFNKAEIYLDSAKINGKLRLRQWKDGDRISAIGVNGSKLVAKIINEAHLSAYQKQRVLVLEDDENIHWIVGIKIGRKALATKASNEILKVQTVSPPHFPPREEDDLSDPS